MRFARGLRRPYIMMPRLVAHRFRLCQRTQHCSCPLACPFSVILCDCHDRFLVWRVSRPSCPACSLSVGDVGQVLGLLGHSQSVVNALGLGQNVGRSCAARSCWQMAQCLWAYGATIATQFDIYIYVWFFRSPIPWSIMLGASGQLRMVSLRGFANCWISPYRLSSLDHSC